MIVSLNSKLFETEIAGDSIDELAYITDELDFPVDERWMAKIALKPHPEAKPEVLYTLKYDPKAAVVELVEAWKGKKYTHPIDVDAELGPIPISFFIEFIQGMPSSMEYAT